MFTRYFTDPKATPTRGKQLGTLTLSIPRARGFRIDRKGRKRRFTDKYELALTEGQGGLNRRALNGLMKKFMSMSPKHIIPGTKFVNKLGALMAGKI